MTRRLAPWIALAVVVVGVLAWVVVRDDDGGSVRARARDLASELRCPDCEGLSVADSSTASARAIRADIRERLQAGQRPADIRQVYVDRYGESILLKPRGDGLGLLVWGLPVAVILLGAAGITVAIRRGRAEPRRHATSADEALVERARDHAP